MNRLGKWLFQFATGVVFVAFAVSSGFSQGSADDAERVRLLKKGVVRVLPSNPNNLADEVGAGVMLGEHAGKLYFVTACHVVDDSTERKIEAFGQRGVFFSASVFANRCDPQLDLAVLVVDQYQQVNPRIIDYVEQLYETDPRKAGPGDRTLILGHPSDEEWKLKESKLDSWNDTKLFIASGAVEARYSGGPLLDTYGNLLGIVTGTTRQSLGEAVRIDVVLKLLDQWGVPYRTKLSVDTCAVVTRLVESSKNGFSDLMGASWDDFGLEQKIWRLNDRRLDITGEGRSFILKNYKTDSRVAYFANFAHQHSLQEANRVWSEVFKRIDDCLPKNLGRFQRGKYKKGDHCLITWYAETKLKTPAASFTVVLRHQDVDLYLTRPTRTIHSGANDECDLPTGVYMLREHWEWVTETH